MIVTVDEIKTLINVDEDVDIYDNFIEANLRPVQDYILDYTNNDFRNTKVYVSGKAIAVKADGTIQITGKDLTGEGFYDECYIAIEGSLVNDGLYRVKSISTDTFTLDDNDNIRDENSTENAYIYRADTPNTIQLVAAQLILHLMRKSSLYDKEVSSEQIGDYRVAYAIDPQDGEVKKIMQMANSFALPGFVSSF